MFIEAGERKFKVKKSEDRMIEGWIMSDDECLEGMFSKMFGYITITNDKTWWV